jgi:hypothetical protein
MEEKGFRYCETCEKWLGPSEICVCMLDDLDRDNDNVIKRYGTCTIDNSYKKKNQNKKI